MKIKASEALELVGQELDEMYARNWDTYGKIRLLQDEVRMMRVEREGMKEAHSEEIAFLNDRLAHTNKSHEYSIMNMVGALWWAFAATGLLLLMMGNN